MPLLYKVLGEIILVFRENIGQGAATRSSIADRRTKLAGQAAKLRGITHFFLARARKIDRQIQPELARALAEHQHPVGQEQRF